MQQTVPGLHVTWEGTVVPRTGGLHRFRLYGSSYFKVFVDGREVLDRWRQNWNPWYHNFDLQLAAGTPHKVRIEWEPDSGYIALLHGDPVPDADRHSLTLSSDFARAVDYYFVPGRSMDDVIAGYRALTGKAPILPKWAYGFWQSRQRYETQDQLLGVLHEYRKLGLPLDNIVQDWLYWPQDQWGCQCFDPARFPNPKAMVDDVHANGAHVMISVWAKFYKGLPNYDALDAIHGMYDRMSNPLPDEPKDPNYIKWMYLDWVGPGYFNAFYDPYNPAARDLYWSQVRQGIESKGFDAWWLDSDEPDFHSNISPAETARRMGPTTGGVPSEFNFNSYPLVHVDGVYDHQVADRPDVRPFILTRSAFGGIQRDSAAVWSGDVASRWDNLREQISAGLNFSLSGDPNWSHDIGGYTMEPRFQKPTPADLAEWRELNTRWFQFGAFSPIFRSHGELIKREIFELSPAGSPTYESMAWYDRLRYRLMPYIYTLGADTWFKDGTIMRALVMDFGADKRVWNIDDQYMFGPAFLVAPVTEYKARSRKVYLPAGTWYDFYSGRSTRGGQTIDATAPYERMPLFVRAGSIVPTGPAVQHTGNNSHSPVTLNVYTGADGSFSLYEDDGTSRQYLHGQYSRIPLQWDEATKTLTIGRREGNGYAGMAGTREILIRWMRPGTPRALAFDAKPDATVTYTGAPLTVRMR
jgi:alpha-D-xyloside xylohydrolase